MEKLALRPGFTFSPSDLVPAGGGLQLRPGTPGAPGTQVQLDLAPARIVAPWEDASTERTTLLNWKHTKQVHAQMEWITENVPGHKSLQKVMDAALLPYIESLLKKHYKPE
jgi:hypothetical protein